MNVIPKDVKELDEECVKQINENKKYSYLAGGAVSDTLEPISRLLKHLGCTKAAEACVKAKR